jgi:hypothetical protein
LALILWSVFTSTLQAGRQMVGKHQIRPWDPQQKRIDATGPRDSIGSCKPATNDNIAPPSSDVENQGTGGLLGNTRGC